MAKTLNDLKGKTVAEAASNVVISHEEPATQQELMLARIEAAEKRAQEAELRNQQLAELLKGKTGNRSQSVAFFEVLGMLRSDTRLTNGKQCTEPHEQYTNSWQLQSEYLPQDGSSADIDKHTIDIAVTLPTITITPAGGYFARVKNAFGSRDIELNESQEAAMFAFLTALGVDVNNAEKLQAIRDKAAVLGAAKKQSKKSSERKVGRLPMSRS